MKAWLSRFRRLPIVSGLLLLAVGAFYVRSYFKSDAAGFYGWSGCLQAIGFDRGSVYLFVSGMRFGPEQAMTVDHVACTHEEFKKLIDMIENVGYPPAKAHGFVLGHVQRGMTDPPDGWYYYAAVPFWIPTTLAALLFLRGVRQTLVRRRRAKRGLCVACGYDIRASHDRCPECNAPIPPISPRAPPITVST